MTDIVLHFAPGSCSRVSLTALLETGAEFKAELMRFGKGGNRSPEYLRLNPKGKVPLLVVDGEPLTENVAILSFLNQMFPEAGLLPPVTTPIDAARQTADLCFCSATLHPVVTRLRMPGRFVAPKGARSVWEKSAEVMHGNFRLIEDRLAKGPWWYGDAWSVMDAYLGWVFWRVEGSDFPVTSYPRFADHNRQLSARPSVKRALEIEEAASAALAAEGLVFNPPPLPA